MPKQERRYDVEVLANDRAGTPHTITGQLPAEYADEAMDRAEDAAAEVGLRPWCATAIPAAEEPPDRGASTLGVGPLDVTPKGVGR